MIPSSLKVSIKKNDAKGESVLAAGLSGRPFSAPTNATAAAPVRNPASALRAQFT